MKAMARRGGVVLGVAIMLGLTTAARAQHQTFHINPARSEARFTFQGANPAVTGTFQLAKSAIEFEKKGPKIGGSVILLAATEKSGDSSRDKAIRTQVLDAPHFAEIIFTPTSFTGSVDVSDGKSVIQVTGTVTVHGQPHQVTVPVEIHSNGDEAIATLHLTVPYVQWGLQDVSGLHIAAGPQVDLELTLKGFLSPEN